MEKVNFTAKVTGKILEIEITDTVVNNSSYDIYLHGIKQNAGLSKFPDTKCTYITKLTPCYTTVDNVMLLIDVLTGLSDEVVLKTIRENSKLASFYTKREYKDQKDVPFEVEHFVKLKTACTLLLKVYMRMIDSVGLKGTLGDISFEKEVKMADISTLLDELKKELAPLENELKSANHLRFISVNRATMSNMNSLNLNGFSRGMD